LIRVGIGGWTFAPWRGPFYPPGLPQAQELAHASRRVTSIEVNGTFYRTQSPASFRKWAQETPDDFVFSVKGHRSITNRARLAEAGEAVERFLGSGLAELGPKLGPILWQLAPTKRFDEADLDAFLSLLPPRLDGRPLRHALEVRHASFLTPALMPLLRRHGVAIVYAESDTYPAIADLSGDFVYARLQRCAAAEPAGYAPAALDLWATRIGEWSQGRVPSDLPRLPAEDVPPGPRDCFVYFISGAKERAPLAAEALIARLP
jgi:uncharacterized protein YecE (DUF72 family)